MTLRLVDMLAGAGWLLLALFAGQLLARLRARDARNRAIDRMIADNRRRAERPPVTRQQRRAAERTLRKAAKTRAAKG